MFERRVNVAIIASENSCVLPLLSSPLGCTVPYIMATSYASMHARREASIRALSILSRTGTLFSAQVSAASEKENTAALIARSLSECPGWIAVVVSAG